jgi:predicted RNase H-like HicB family nuclease
MTYSIIFEKVTDTNFPAGYYYAHGPALDLTTHGLGIEGARVAAMDLLKLWIEEKRSQGEDIPRESEILFSKIDVEDAVLIS